MMIQSKKGDMEKGVDLFFIIFLLILAFTGVLIFSYQVKQDQLESFTTEKTLYINHIFSKRDCLAYDKEGIVMPYFVNYEELKPKDSSDEIKDIKGCLNLDKETTPFSMLLAFYPKGLEPINVSYDWKSFKSWSLLPQGSLSLKLSSNLNLMESRRKITFVFQGKEYGGFVKIFSIFPK